jgi:threonylcarbamoyladenosine tRNA methylthiotransferase MtaB
VRALDKSRGDVTFRLGSIEPMEFPRPLVDVVERSGRFAPHFHLPLQHGSNRMLGAMRRPYSVERYRRLVDGIRGRLPHAAIGADIIAGFPGESDVDARTNEDAVAALPFSHLHVFPYSDRPGTEAAGMRPKVAPAEIQARAARLRGIGARLSARFARAQVGSIRPGLTLEDGTTVLTDNFLKVAIPPGLGRNVRVRVRIDGAAPRLAGHIV